MSKYKSRYPELSFYANGKERKFSAGVYVATTPDEIAVLERIPDAIKEPEEKTEEKAPAPEVKPASKQRKASAK